MTKTIYIYERNEHTKRWIQTTKEYDEEIQSIAISPKGDDIVIEMKKLIVEKTNNFKTLNVKKFIDINNSKDLEA